MPPATIRASPLAPPKAPANPRLSGRAASSANHQRLVQGGRSPPPIADAISWFCLLATDCHFIEIKGVQRSCCRGHDDDFPHVLNGLRPGETSCRFSPTRFLRFLVAPIVSQLRHSLPPFFTEGNVCLEMPRSHIARKISICTFPAFFAARTLHEMDASRPPICSSNCQPKLVRRSPTPQWAASGLSWKRTRNHRWAPPSRWCVI